jgi:N-carbamoylputrescine amidase
MKVTFIESAEGLTAKSTAWQLLSSQIAMQQPDVLVTNEMPFGAWLAVKNQFNLLDAGISVSAHDEGLEALSALNIPLILSSRPILLGQKLANEAFALIDGEYCAAHHKHYFPNESGFYEVSWFEARKKGFDVITINELVVGFLLCTEVMFNEWARHYGRQGAHLIVVPRATGQNFTQWKTAASMAAIVSGCYVVSSNRVGQYDDTLTFGGKGFAFAPDGILICETTAQNPVVSFELDLDLVKCQQTQYPCYVLEEDISLLG